MAVRRNIAPPVGGTLPPSGGMTKPTRPKLGPGGMGMIGSIAGQAAGLATARRRGPGGGKAPMAGMAGKTSFMKKRGGY